MKPCFLSRKEIEAAVMPLPRAEITPPDTNTYFGRLDFDMHNSTVNLNILGNETKLNRILLKKHD